MRINIIVSRFGLTCQVRDEIDAILHMKFIRKGPIINIPSLVQVMAWRRPGDKPLSEPIMIIELTYISITWPQ